MTKKSKIDMVFSASDVARMHDHVQEYIDAFPSAVAKLLPSEYSEQYRVLPVNTPYPGKWRNDLTPYSVEIMDFFSPRSGVQETIWLKSSQVGATASMESMIAYVIAEAPGPILYVSSKEDLLRRWVGKRFNPLIKSCGLEDKIFKQNTLKGNRATGNQMFSKEFAGGSLDIVSAQSEDNLRMDSIRYLILDEASSYPWSVSGLGDPIAIARARTANFGSRRRVYMASTPGVEGECRMLPLYREGDQRRFFLPCPLCSERFVLRFRSEPNDFYEGIPDAQLTYDTDAGILNTQSVHVVCPHCGGKVPESHRYTMIQAGRWIPTAKPSRPGVRSYQIGRLYSLMDDWVRQAQLELDSQQDPLVMQTFMNHAAGWPYRPTTQKPDISKIYELRGAYDEGEIPTEDVLFLTGAVDVQRGSQNNPDKPPRLEVEICGHGLKYRTWSMYYRVFPGPVNDPYQGAWEDFYQWIESGGMTCRRSDGLTMQPRIVLVDSGDGMTETAVFDFCHRLKGFIPVKGVAELKKSTQGHRTDTILDERGPRDRDRFREHTKYDQVYYSLYTAWWKNILWRALKIERQPGSDQRPRFQEFPRSYPDRYFDMLVAEERREDGSFWRPESRANESLDLKIYNMAACDIFLYLAVKGRRKEMSRAPGWTKEMADQIQSRHILDQLSVQMKRKLITH